MTEALSGLAQSGRLRAAINLGNRALVQQVDGELGGISPALARRLASEIDAELVPILYDGAGLVFADAGGGAWDVAFLAIDSRRAEAVSFARPYVTIEVTYAVRMDSRVRQVAEADTAGLSVLVASGSAYDLYLTDALRHARIERAETPAESFAAFRAGRSDAVAGVRQSLERAFAGDPAFRMLPGFITRVEQGMVLPRRADPRIGALDAFVARAIADGFVAGQLA